MNLNLPEYLKWHLASLLWAEHKFNCRGPSTSTTDENIEAVKKMILDNCRITIREVADDVGISFGSCQAIFTDIFGMKSASAIIVSKSEQKQHRMDIAEEMLSTFNGDPDLLKKIITVNESWVYGYDIETKAQSSQWKAFC